MSSNRLATPGCYLYAVADAVEQADAPPGLDGGPVYAVQRGALAAWVSNVTATKIRPERKNLGAHHAVVRGLMERFTVLPVAFGTVARNRTAVERLLRDQQDLLDQHLQRVRDKVEMEVRVLWDVPNIFEYFVDRHPELARRRDQLRKAMGHTAAKDRIELGRLFHQLQSQERARATEVVSSVLSACCADIDEQPARQGHEVMRLACLVERAAMPQFDAAVLAAARQFDDRHAFRSAGPWAPHHFVQLVLDLDQ